MGVASVAMGVASVLVGMAQVMVGVASVVIPGPRPTAAPDLQPWLPHDMGGAELVGGRAEASSVRAGGGVNSVEDLMVPGLGFWSQRSALSGIAR